MTDTYSSPRKSKACRNLANMLSGTDGIPESVHQYLPPLPETPRAPRTEKKSSALSRFLSRYELPPNDALSSLPPLPETPRQPIFQHPSTSRKAVDAYHRSTPSGDRVERMERRGDARLNDTSLSTPPPSSMNRTSRSHTYNGLSRIATNDNVHPQKASPRYPSQPAYPMLSSRQSGLGLNTARTPSGSSTSPFAGVTSTARTGISSRIASPDVSLESPTTVHHPSTRGSTASKPAADVRSQLGPPSPSMYASFRLPKGLADASLLQDASFGMIGGRDSLGSVGDESWEVNAQSRKVHEPTRQAHSPTIATNVLLQATIDRPRGKQTTSPQYTTATPRQKGSPAKRRGGFTPAQALSESTLLPTSPSKGAHLLESINALHRVVPPWASSSEASVNTSFLDQTQLMPTLPKVIAPEASPIVGRDIQVQPDTYPVETSGSPMKASTMGGFLAPPVAVPRRKVPAASASSAKTVPGPSKNTAHPEVGDVSSIFPVSPMKHRHLLEDEHDLLREKLDMSSVFDIEGPSMFVTSRSSTSPTKTAQNLAVKHEAARNLKAVSPVKRTGSSPATAATSSRQSIAPVKGIVDQTMDLKDMMAMFRKPARGSTAEETFMDLMNASMDDLDGLVIPASPLLATSRGPISCAMLISSQMLGDETFFLPLDLRPCHPTLVRSKSLSRIETEKRIAKVRASIAARDVLLTSPDKGSTSSQSWAKTVGEADGAASDDVGEFGEVRGRRRESAERSKRVSLSAGPRLASRRETVQVNREEEGDREAELLRANTAANGRTTSNPAGTLRARPLSGIVSRSEAPLSPAQSSSGPRGAPSAQRVASGASATSAASRTSSKISAPPVASTRTARPTSMVSAPSAARVRNGSTASSARSAGGIAPTARNGSTASTASSNLRTAKTSAGPMSSASGIARSATTGALATGPSSRLSSRPVGTSASGASARPSTRTPSDATAPSGTRVRPAANPSAGISSSRAQPSRTFGTEASSTVNRGAPPASRGTSSALTKTKSSMPPPPVPATSSKRSVPFSQNPRTAGPTERLSSRPAVSAAATASSSGTVPAARTRSTPAAVVTQAQRTAVPPRSAGTMRAAPTSSASSRSSVVPRPGMPFRSDSDTLSTDMPASFRTAPTASGLVMPPPRTRTAVSSTSIHAASAAVINMKMGKLASGTGSVSRAKPGSAAAGLADIRARLDRMQAQQGVPR